MTKQHFLYWMCCCRFFVVRFFHNGLRTKIVSNVFFSKKSITDCVSWAIICGCVPCFWGLSEMIERSLPRRFVYSSIADEKCLWLSVTVRMVFIMFLWEEKEEEKGNVLMISIRGYENKLDDGEGVWGKVMLYGERVLL